MHYGRKTRPLPTEPPATVRSLGHPNDVLAVLEGGAVASGSVGMRVGRLANGRHPSVVEAVVAGDAAGAHPARQE